MRLSQGTIYLPVNMELLEKTELGEHGLRVGYYHKQIVCYLEQHES